MLKENGLRRGTTRSSSFLSTLFYFLLFLSCFRWRKKKTSRTKESQMQIENLNNPSKIRRSSSVKGCPHNIPSKNKSKSRSTRSRSSSHRKSLDLLHKIADRPDRRGFIRSSRSKSASKTGNNYISFRILEKSGYFLPQSAKREAVIE